MFSLGFILSKVLVLLLLLLLPACLPAFAAPTSLPPFHHHHHHPSSSSFSFSLHCCRCFGYVFLVRKPRQLPSAPRSSPAVAAVAAAWRSETLAAENGSQHSSGPNKAGHTEVTPGGCAHSSLLIRREH